MTNTITPDGLLFLSALATAAIITLLYIVINGLRNNGIAVVPGFFLFGVWGLTISPWLILIISSQRDNKALIEHERCHQMQMTRDGTSRFRHNNNIGREPTIAATRPSRYLAATSSTT